MADINSVFGEQREYDPSKPYVTFELPTKEELLGMLMGIIPGARALKNMHDNPEGSAAETLDLLAEDVVPFYAAAKNGADWDDYAKEAALMFTPVKGPRRAVHKNPNGTFDSRDLGAWIHQKELQRSRVSDKIKERDPAGIIPELEHQLNMNQHSINDINEILAMDLDPIKRKEFTDKLVKYQKRDAELRNEINRISIDALGYNGRTLNDFWNNYFEDDFIDRALRREGISDIDKAKFDAGISNVMHNFKAPEY